MNFAKPCVKYKLGSCLHKYEVKSEEAKIFYFPAISARIIGMRGYLGAWQPCVMYSKSWNDICTDMRSKVKGNKLLICSKNINFATISARMIGMRGYSCAGQK